MQCPKCHEAVSPSQRFCEACGFLLSEKTATVPAPIEISGDGAAASGCKCPPGMGKPDEAGYCEICGVKIGGGAKAAILVRPEECAEYVFDAQLAMLSHPGRKHPLNEDAAVVERTEDGKCILIVADGVSSSWNAKLASATAARVVRECLVTADGQMSAEETMRSALDSGHRAVKALPQQDPDSRFEEPATTMVAALVNGSELTIGWVGDSRAYLVPTDASQEIALTIDDSWATLVVASGKMTLEEALASKQSRYVTQTLGMNDDAPEIHVKTFPLGANQRLLLCTDGLWNYLPAPGNVAEALAISTVDAVDQCRHLVELANERGGKDNITVALLIP